jgi:heme-degrading monooxygenase HmoA
MARYTFSGDAQELARRAEDGLLPIFQAQPGFKAYSVIESDGEILSFSAWDSAEQAEAANAAAADWVAENMTDDIDLKETRIGEIVISTALGVTTKAGATA